MESAREKFCRSVVEQLERETEELSFELLVMDCDWMERNPTIVKMKFLGVLEECLTVDLRLQIDVKNLQKQVLSGFFFASSQEEHQKRKKEAGMEHIRYFGSLAELNEQVKEELAKIKLKNVFLRSGLFYIELIADKILKLAEENKIETTKTKVISVLERRLGEKTVIEREKYLRSCVVDALAYEDGVKIYFRNVREGRGHLIESNELN